ETGHSYTPFKSGRNHVGQWGHRGCVARPSNDTPIDQYPMKFENPRKRCWQAIEAVAHKTGRSFRGLADEFALRQTFDGRVWLAFGYFLKKHHQPDRGLPSWYFRLAIIAASMTTTVWYALIRGQDVGWDQRNYHIGIPFLLEHDTF